MRLRATKENLITGDSPGEPSARARDMMASFQKAVVDALIDRTFESCRRESIRTVLVTGGVASNSRLRSAFAEVARTEGIRVCVPSQVYTTDNAAMIAAAGFLHLERDRIAPLDLNADANLRL